MHNSYKLHIFITIAIMVFIFIQSALPGHVSGAESGFFVSMLHELTHVDFDVLSLIDSAGVAVGVGIMLLIAYNKRVTSVEE